MKIALFCLKGMVEIILDHEPVGADIVRVSEWVEVEFKRIPHVVEHNYCYDYE